MAVKKYIRFYTLFAIAAFAHFNAQSQITSVQSSFIAVPDTGRTDAFMKNLLKQYPQYFDSIVAKSKVNNVQIIYTKVDRGANGIAALKQYYFNVNSNSYFYPAMAVKLPVAILTLQKMAALKQNGIDKNTTMLTEKGYSGQTAVYNDPTTPEGKPTIAQYLKKMLIAGDEDAYNRLYEFLGQQYINDQLHNRGYAGVQITERLNADLSEDENRHTNPIKFLATGNAVLYQQPMQFNQSVFAERNDSLGQQNFSKKNRISLEDLHAMLISLVFPNKITSSQRFLVSDEDRKYLLKYMSQLPTETINPPYNEDAANYYAAYRKFLMSDSLSKNIRIFNAAGEGNGQVIDAAYIVDFDKKIEFFLSAVIYCNSDGSISDDNNKTIGLPFMKHLGEVIYEYEVKREKRIFPDLSEVKFDYDGR